MNTLDEMLTPIEEMVANHPDVETYSVSSGGGMMAMGGGGASVSVIVLD